MNKKSVITLVSLKYPSLESNSKALYELALYILFHLECKLKQLSYNII